MSLYDLNIIEVRLPDRKSTRLNSSHSQISYAVFCLKKKKKNKASRDNDCRSARTAVSFKPERETKVDPYAVSRRTWWYGRTLSRHLQEPGGWEVRT